LPFINHTAVLPVVSRHTRSLLPSPLKSWLAQPSACRARSTLIRGLVWLPAGRKSGIAGRVSFMGMPVLCNAASIRSTVASGQTVRIAAKAPATWGAAMEVPKKQL
jgi:hypothetical protein